jgi:pyruvate formate lyase activating enzyme
MMHIAGLQETSLLDYPDYISAIVWTQGCPFRCPYCYNRDIVIGSGPLIPEDDVLSFLKKRRRRLEAVVVSGGEPLMQDGLRGFLHEVKALGYLVKVDTNGMFPERLEVLLDEGLVDYVAMDVKAPPEKYSMAAGVRVPADCLERSMRLIRECAPAYEFRTTVVPGVLSKEDVVAIGRWLQGSSCYFLQQFKPIDSLIDASLKEVVPYSKQRLEEMMAAVQPFFQRCGLRGV